MKTPQDVILAPVISEKSYQGMEVGKYTFKVAKGANKTEIRQAAEAAFGVNVQDVNIIQVRGKLRRQGKTSGMTPSWKKAVVTVRPGEKIEIFEKAGG